MEVSLILAICEVHSLVMLYINKISNAFKLLRLRVKLNIR